jgi:hypothetical protein
MQFIGAIDTAVRRILQEVLMSVPRSTPVVVRCCGAFTHEQILTRLGFSRIVSNDVSFYTTFLAHYVLGKPFEFTVCGEAQEYVSYTGDVEHDLVQFLWWADLSRVSQRRHFHEERFFSFLLRHRVAICQQYHEKVRRWKSLVKISEYYAQDVFDFFDQYVTADMLALVAPPTYKGGYERMYRKIDEGFCWNRPIYRVIDPRDFLLPETLSVFTWSPYIISLGREVPFLPCVGRVKGKGKPVFIYSSLRGSVYLRKGLHETVKAYSILPYDVPLPVKAKISILPVSNNVVNHYRNLFLTPLIDYGNSYEGWLWFVNDWLWGVSLFGNALSGGSMCQDVVFLIADFTVPSCHQRLSKLLLMLLRSKDVRERLQRIFFREITLLKTTVFSDAAVSMKYRGVFQQESRDRGRLIYSASFAEYTLAGGYSLWCQKYREIYREAYCDGSCGTTRA